MSILIRRVNGYDVYIHSTPPHGPVYPSGYLHLTLGRSDDPIQSCLGVDCNTCPVGMSIRQTAFGVSDMQGQGCRECSRKILASTRVYRRPTC